MFPSDLSTVTQSITQGASDKATGFIQSKIRPTQLQLKPVGSPRVALSHLYSFFNESSVAIDQSSNLHLNNFINYILENAESLRQKKQECFFSRWKYKRQELTQFFTFISTIRYLVSFTRDFYKTSLYLETSTPFISVSHDGWDSKDNDVLGVSIHFIVPKYWRNVSMAIGLRRIYSKNAENVVNCIKSILLR